MPTKGQRPSSRKKKEAPPVWPPKDLEGRQFSQVAIDFAVDWWAQRVLDRQYKANLNGGPQVMQEVFCDMLNERMRERYPVTPELRQAFCAHLGAELQSQVSQGRAGYQWQKAHVECSVDYHPGWGLRPTSDHFKAQIPESFWPWKTSMWLHRVERTQGSVDEWIIVQDGRNERQQVVFGDPIHLTRSYWGWDPQNTGQNVNWSVEYIFDTEGIFTHKPRDIRLADSFQDCAHTAAESRKSVEDSLRYHKCEVPEFSKIQPTWRPEQNVFTPEFLKELMTQASLLHDKLLGFPVFRTQETLQQAHHAYSLIEIWANCAWMHQMPRANAARCAADTLSSGQPGSDDSDE